MDKNKWLREAKVNRIDFVIDKLNEDIKSFGYDTELWATLLIRSKKSSMVDVFAEKILDLITRNSLDFELLDIDDELLDEEKIEGISGIILYFGGKYSFLKSFLKELKTLDTPESIIADVYFGCTDRPKIVNRT